MVGGLSFGTGPDNEFEGCRANTLRPCVVYGPSPVPCQDASRTGSPYLQKSADPGQYGLMYMSPPGSAAARPDQTPVVSFHRTELNLITSLYGRMVALGEWRDYGISMLRDVAVFSIFRRAAEHPLYRIEKRPKLAGRQGQYQIIAMDGQILKRGDDLKTVLRVLERKLIRLAK